MYRITVYDYFSSAHQLRGYKGKCEHVHGHNWKVEVTVGGGELDGIGMLIDFHEIKNILEDVISVLDHRMLNEIEPFNEKNPSSELLAQYIYYKIKEKLPHGIKMIETSIWEAERSKATYLEE